MCVYPGIGDHGGYQVAQFLTTDYASRLRTLSLRNSALSDSAVAAIAKALPQARLQGLDLSGNQLTMIGFHKLMAASVAGSSLQYLNVGKNPIFTGNAVLPSQLMPSILNLSQSIHRLTILGMSCTGFSDKLCSFENSPFALMTIPSLTVLDLSNNDITDKSIAMIICFMSNVEYLSLSGNRISSDGGKKLIAKAEELLETADSDEQSSCHLQRIWLGSNDIEGSVLAECTCKIITSDLLTLEGIPPEFVPAMFSSSPMNESLVRCLRSSITGKEVLLPIRGNLRCLFLSQELRVVMDLAIGEQDHACFQRWFMRGVHTVVHHSDSDIPVERAQRLLNLFGWLVIWYGNTRVYMLHLAVLCCKICVIDELMLTHGIHELEPRAENTLRHITQLSAQNSDYLLWMVQFMSGLAECCTQRHLYPVADCLLQQMEYVSQKVWDIILSSK